MKKRTVLVHDWLNGMRGGEKVLESIYGLYPSPIYTLVHDPSKLKGSVFEGAEVYTSGLQKIPFAQKFYRYFLSQYPSQIENFDLSDFDVILSTSHAVAKGVLTNANQLHICYIHTPMRYAWDLHFQYMKEAGLSGFKKWYFKKVLHRIRTWDVISSNRVDYFIANSKYIAKRVMRVYRREAEVIYPPVDVDSFAFKADKENYYLAASSMVPYKKIDLIVRAFAELPQLKLVVVGSGPDKNKIKKLAAGHPNIELVGHLPFEELKKVMQNAKAFVFAAEEDFGIMPVEAQACGTPVIAYGKGGACETVIPGQTGLWFEEQTEAALIQSIRSFEEMKNGMNPVDIRKHAEEFSRDVFEERYRQFVSEKAKEFFDFF